MSSTEKYRPEQANLAKNVVFPIPYKRLFFSLEWDSSFVSTILLHLEMSMSAPSVPLKQSSPCRACRSKILYKKQVVLPLDEQLKQL